MRSHNTVDGGMPGRRMDGHNKMVVVMLEGNENSCPAPRGKESNVGGSEGVDDYNCQRCL